MVFAIVAIEINDSRGKFYCAIVTLPAKVFVTELSLYLII